MNNKVSGGIYYVPHRPGFRPGNQVMAIDEICHLSRCHDYYDKVLRIFYLTNAGSLAAQLWLL